MSLVEGTTPAYQSDWSRWKQELPRPHQQDRCKCGSMKQKPTYRTG